MALSQKMLTDHVIPQPADSELLESHLWEFKKTAAAVQGWWHFSHCLRENKGFFLKAVQQQHHSVVQPYQTKTRILFHLIQTITSYLVNCHLSHDHMARRYWTVCPLPPLQRLSSVSRRVTVFFSVLFFSFSFSHLLFHCSAVSSTFRVTWFLTVFALVGQE